MNNEESKRLYESFSALYKARGEDRINFAKITEQYFTDVLKLLITLSTGMIAFLSISSLLKAAEDINKIYPLVGYIMTILFAVIAYILLIIHYKRYADEASTEEARLFYMWSSKKLDDIQRIIKNKEENFANKQGEDWQKSTITFAVLSCLTFFVSTVIVACLSISSMPQVKVKTNKKQQAILMKMELNKKEIDKLITT